MVADDSAPCHVSTASDASSEGSNASLPPPLLYFLNATCMATARLVSYFPCAVADINDSDDHVVDMLSRENAMNIMYGKRHNNSIVISNSLTYSESDSPVLDDGTQSLRDEDKSMDFIQITEVEQTAQNDVSMQSTPHTIVDDDSHDAQNDVSIESTTDSHDGDMDTISLNAGDGGVDSDGVNTIIMRNWEPQASKDSESEIPVSSPPNDPQKKKEKRKFGMKLFRRKKKA